MNFPTASSRVSIYLFCLFAASGGEFTLMRLNSAVADVLRVKFLLRLFEKPYTESFRMAIALLL